MALSNHLATQAKCSFSGSVIKQVGLQYLLYIPKGYDEERSEKWPLILFLHGMGERGSDLELVKKHGIPKIVEEKDDFPFIAVSPQCPIDSFWTHELDALNALLDEIVAKYAVDEKRLYLTGLSMGGFGTWHLAVEHPERFAAIVPICGGVQWAMGFPEKARVLKDMPIWAFHGAKDPTVPVQESERIVKAINDYGGHAELTIYPDADHNSWTRTYENPELYTWFLKHKRQ